MTNRPARVDTRPVGRSSAPGPSAGRRRIALAGGGLLVVIVIAAIIVLRLPRSDTDPAPGIEPASATNLRLPRMSGDSWDQIDNPEEDGWQTEVFNDNANVQLKKLGKLLEHGAPIDSAELQSIIADQFVCGPIEPADLETVFEDRAIKVQRSRLPVASVPEPGDGEYRGAEGFAEALNAVAQHFDGARDVHFKFKLFRVEPSGDELTTTQFFAISGRNDQAAVEQNSTWVARWRNNGGDGMPRLTGLSVGDFEMITTQNGSQPLFADCTESALQADPSYATQLLRSYEHWLNQTESRAYWAQLGTPGIAIGDVNGDGLQDLYLCQERGIPNLLFLQNGDGTVRESSAESGVNWLEDSRSALLVDWDNDGDQDLAVGMAGGVALAANDGRGRFELKTVLPTVHDVKSLCAADYDLDGKLDLYVTVYYQNVFDGQLERTGLFAARTAQVMYDNNGGGANSLFHNEIADTVWKMTDVTQEVGLNVNNSRYSLAAIWEDFDNDGDQDLYVANDYGSNNMYRNDGGRFVDVSQQSGTEDHNFAMSVTCGDYDRDGEMDIYISNMFSAAGNRVTFQEQFKPDASDEIKRRFQHLARGNTLFRNAGNGRFQDTSNQAGVTMGRWAWSSNFVDLNNDGWEDLVVANGMTTTDDPGDC